jgi:hypothetical protein
MSSILDPSPDHDPAAAAERIGQLETENTALREANKLIPEDRRVELMTDLFGVKLAAATPGSPDQSCGSATARPVPASRQWLRPIKTWSCTSRCLSSAESIGFKLSVGNSVHINLEPDTRAEADRLFNALSKDGKVEMSM